jgi:predicted Zn-dependent protease
MTKAQFWILNTVSLVLVVLSIVQFVTNRTNAQMNNALNQQMNQQQPVINHGQQLEPILDQLAKRIARDSETNAALRELLIKHDLRVTLEVDGKKKNYP